MQISMTPQVQFLYNFIKILAYVKKKLYLCSRKGLTYAN